MQSLQLVVEIVYFYYYEEKTRTKTGYPFNAFIISTEHTTIAII
jgi:hypothetical protein